MNHRGFTIIEVLVSILIFWMGLLAAYVLISGAGNLSLRSKQEIIASNLLREQIELVKNVRDSNYLALRNYNSLKWADPDCGSNCKILPGYLAVSWNYKSGEPPVLVKNNLFDLSVAPTNAGKQWRAPGPTAHKDLVALESKKSLGASNFRYCLDTLGRYLQGKNCAVPGVTPTAYYGFMLVRPVITSGSSGNIEVPDALNLTAYFATTEGGYREFSISTIITDFKN